MLEPTYHLKYPATATENIQIQPDTLFKHFVKFARKILLI